MAMETKFVDFIAGKKQRKTSNRPLYTVEYVHLKDGETKHIRRDQHHYIPIVPPLNTCVCIGGVDYWVVSQKHFVDTAGVAVLMETLEGGV